MTHWRNTYKVHPTADVFPMMSDAELDELGADIKKNGLRHPIIVMSDDDGQILLDGRNRLEAAERAGAHCWEQTVILGNNDPVAYIISANLRRRHLTKQQQADLILAAVKAAAKPPQAEVVSAKGGRGKVNPVKAKAVKIAADAGISKATVERAIAKAAPAPRPKQYAAKPLPKPRPGKPVVGLEATRRHYLDLCAGAGVDLEEERRLILGAFLELELELAGKRKPKRNGLCRTPQRRRATRPHVAIQVE